VAFDEFPRDVFEKIPLAANLFGSLALGIGLSHLPLSGGITTFCRGAQSLAPEIARCFQIYGGVWTKGQLARLTSMTIPNRERFCATWLHDKI